jgi:hypothetical protein
VIVLMNDGQSRKPTGDEQHNIPTLHVDLNNSGLPTAGDVSGDAQPSRPSSVFNPFLG